MPRNRSYLAFDLGASSCRAVLGTFDGRAMHMKEVHRFRTPVVVEGERLYWDLEAVWRELDASLRRAATQHAVCSVSVDSWGVDYVPLDHAMQPVRRAHCYRDTRVAAIPAEIARRASSREIFAASGVQPQYINTLFQVVADQILTPDDYYRTATRLFIADWFNYRFSGRAVAEVSVASTSQVFSPITMSWAVPLLKRLNLDPASWPLTVPSGSQLGNVTRGGRPIAVIAGCSHDTACAVAAVPAKQGGRSWAFLSSGTWSILGAERKQPVLTGEALNRGFTNEVGFNGTIRLLKNLTGLWVLQECERTWREAGAVLDYKTLLAEAQEAAETANELLDLSDGRFATRGNMPGMIRAWCHERGQRIPESRGSVVRLILESLAEAYRLALGELEELTGEKVSVLYIVGGGARNALLNQWTADRCACRVVAGPAEATALGNLLVQAYAMGHLADAHEVRQVAANTSRVRTYEPRSAQ